MQIAVVDDEKETLEMMKRLLQKFGRNNHICFQISCFESGESFLEQFSKDSYSLVFMDIYMKSLSGVDTARKMRIQDNVCMLVFLTSSMDFMPDAFSCHAFEYIIKPFTEERIFQVLQEVLKVLPSSSKYIGIVSGRKTIPVFLSDILSVVSSGHYLDITLSDGTSLRSRMTVSEFLRRTEEDTRFLSVNKGIVLNADYISEIRNNCCTLENGSTFPVRVRDCQRLNQAVQDYNFEKLRNMQRHSR